MFASWYDFKVGIVRLFRRSEYCHVGLAWVVGKRVFVLEAVVPTIRIYPLSKLGDFYLLNVPAKWDYEVVETEALAKVGLPYSTAAAIKSSFVDLDPEDVSECAAYVIHILLVAGVDLGKIATPDAVVLKAQQIEDVQTMYVLNPGV
jgi:hypothetical protein